MTYRRQNPPVIPAEQSVLLEYLMRELEAIERSQQASNSLRLNVTYVEPTKVGEGLIVLADGTEWDPGSGAGIYAYIGGSWTKL